MDKESGGGETDELTIEELSETCGILPLDIEYPVRGARPSIIDRVIGPEGVDISVPYGLFPWMVNIYKLYTAVSVTIPGGNVLNT